MRIPYPITPSGEVSRPCGDVSISFSDPVLSEDLPVPLLPWLEREPRPPEGRRHQSRVRQLRPQAGRRADLPELRNHLRQGEWAAGAFLNLNLNSVLLFKLLKTTKISMITLVNGYMCILGHVDFKSEFKADLWGRLGCKTSFSVL